jgi:hypothetical protein
MDKRWNMVVLASMLGLIAGALACTRVGAIQPAYGFMDSPDDVGGYIEGNQSSCFTGSNNYPNIDIVLIEHGYVPAVGYEFNITISGNFTAENGVDFRVYFDVVGGALPPSLFSTGSFFIQLQASGSPWESRIFVNGENQVANCVTFPVGSPHKAVFTLPDANTGWINGIPGLLPEASWVNFGYSKQQPTMGHFQYDTLNWPAMAESLSPCTTGNGIPGYGTSIMLITAGIAIVGIIAKRKR